MSFDEKCTAYISHKGGKKYMIIAKELGRAPNTISKLLTKAQKNNTLDNQHAKKGRFPKGSSILNDDHKRFILKWLHEGEHKSSREIWTHLTSIKKVKRVGYDAVNNFIKEIGKWVVPRLKQS